MAKTPVRSAKSSGRPSAYAGTSTTKTLLGAKRKAAAPAARKAPARQAEAPEAITLLRADHKLVTKLFEEANKMKGASAKKKALVERICNELTVHTTIEEEIFYPAARAALKDGGMMDEALVEHDGAKKLIAQLRGVQAGDDMYDAKVKVLSEYIKHHVKEEQTEMFPKAHKTKMDMQALGEKMLARKQTLMAGIDQIRG
jgi:hemerythrin-like domain-containing protein